MPKYSDYAALILTSGLGYPRITDRNCLWTINRSQSSLPFRRCQSMTSWTALVAEKDHRSCLGYGVPFIVLTTWAMTAPQNLHWDLQGVLILVKQEHPRW